MRLIDADALLDKQESLYMKGNVLFHGVTACAIENATTIQDGAAVNVMRKHCEETIAEYIDRQAVLDAIFPVDLENDGSDGCTVVLQNQSFTSIDIEGIVSEIPAADVRPVVHAQWKDGPEIKVFKEEKIPTVQCPKCLLYFGDLLNNHREIYRFCPYCGAQMDGGTGNER